MNEDQKVAPSGVHAWLPLLRCPACRGALRAGGAEYVCRECQAAYPEVDGIPVLVRNPKDFLGYWVRMFESEQKAKEAWRRGVEKSLADPGLPAMHRERIRVGLEHAAAQQKTIETLMGPVVALGRDAAVGEPALGYGVWGYLSSTYNYVIRDWATGDAENAALLRVARELFPRGTERLLGLAAGGGRLVYDAQRSLGIPLALALDIAPLPFLILQRILRGETLRLLEYARFFKGSRHTIPHDCRAPAPVSGTYQPLLADVRTLPLIEESMDAVLTVFFPETLEKSLLELTRLIHRTLRRGGRWIHIQPSGSLYSDAEMLEIARAGGLRVVHDASVPLTHLASPNSNLTEDYTCLALAAERP